MSFRGDSTKKETIDETDARAGGRFESSVDEADIVIGDGKYYQKIRYLE